MGRLRFRAVQIRFLEGEEGSAVRPAALSNAFLGGGPEESPLCIRLQHFF